MRAYSLIIGFLLASVGQVVGQNERVLVGILRDRPVQNLMLQAKTGSYKVVGGGNEYVLRPDDVLSIKKEGNQLVARTLSQEIRTSGTLAIEPRSVVSRIKIRSSRVDVAARLYQGTMLVTATRQGITGSVDIPLEQYVAGVVQSESGKGRHAEYYKLQSIICRTYVLANKGKHAHEGYQVCDETHCQVFKGGSDYDLINQAVAETAGQVLVDSEIRFVDATFHSNCGGETVNSEDVWTKEVSYLRSIQDKYCTKAKHSSWYRTIPKDEWLSYLERSFGLDISDQSTRQAALNYEPVCRDVYFANLFPLMPLERIRTDWNLKSTFFSVAENGGNVLLEGTGFGHGVGMCQEGAMVMALTDRDFRQILHHYYSDIHLIDIGALDFFRDEEVTELSKTEQLTGIRTAPVKTSN